MAAEIEMELAAGNPNCPYVIQRDCEHAYDFEQSWVAVCKRAGVPEALFHDLRRTSLINMIEVGGLKSDGSQRTPDMLCSSAVTF